MKSLFDQTLALAGLIQACRLVDDVARTGNCDNTALEASIASLFETSPESTEQVFGGKQGVALGLNLLIKLLDKSDAAKQENWVRYALSVMHLERQLRKNQDMLMQISKGLSQAESPRNHFGLLHENTFANLAGTYQSTISTFRTRIQVNGEPHILKSEHNASKIRALLLAAMRSAMLWRQVGGHRWHLLFKRRAIVEEAKRLLAAA